MSGTDRGLSLITARAIALATRTIGAPTEVTEVAGDASTRRFFRLRAGRRKAILMLHPEPLDPSSPLYSNHRILAGIGAPVPRILGSDDQAGLVLVEDFGDTTLQKHLLGNKDVRRGGSGGGQRGREVRRRLYREACDLIVLLQRRGREAIRADDFAARQALDRERFLLELDHFHRHFIGALRGMTPSGPEEAILRSFYTDLAEECDRMPRTYCHRDFQSRNLMLRREGSLGLIDFQDARLGPCTYDAASLLRDSSLDLDESLVDEMVEHLTARLSPEAPEEFRRDFDRMALQRNIKDLGTFGYMATARGLRSYLEYVPRTIRSVKRTLLRDRRIDPIFSTLDKYILSYGD